MKSCQEKMSDMLTSYGISRNLGLDERSEWRADSMLSIGLACDLEQPPTLHTQLILTAFAYPAPGDGDAQEEVKVKRERRERRRKRKKKEEKRREGGRVKEKERVAVGRAVSKHLAKAVPGAAEWGQVVPSASLLSHTTWTLRRDDRYQTARRI